MSISPLAVISKGVEIGTGVTVHPFAILHEGVVLGSGVSIGAYCEIGVPTPLAQTKRLVIGSSSTIRSHSVFYSGSEFGQELITGHHVTVRENIKTGKNFQIGTSSELQGDTTIGDYVRLHSGVFVAKNAKIGNYIWLLPNVVITDDPHPPSNLSYGVTLEDFVVVAAQSILLPGIVVRKGAVIGAGSVVTSDVSANTLVAGVPATPRGATSAIKLRDGTGRSAYPWFMHFERGYPAEVVREWRRTIRSED
jgi:acetyltransferase-like isoleucine patch superfamily enzyme